MRLLRETSQLSLFVLEDVFSLPQEFDLAVLQCHSEAGERVRNLLLYSLVFVFHVRSHAFIVNPVGSKKKNRMKKLSSQTEMGNNLLDIAHVFESLSTETGNAVHVLQLLLGSFGQTNCGRDFGETPIVTLRKMEENIFN